MGQRYNLPTQSSWLVIFNDGHGLSGSPYSLSKNMKAESTSMAAFKQAGSKRSPGDKLIFHSDRGIQYACKAFTDELSDQDYSQSMRRMVNEPAMHPA